jgi:hypothetical protein
MTEAVLEAGSWIYKMIITLIVAVICVAAVGLVIRSETNTIDLQRELVFNRVLYDPQGIIWVDDGIAHPGIIDKSRIEQTHVSETFQYLDRYCGIGITLLDNGERQTVVVNEGTLRLINTGVQAGITGTGSLVTRAYPVRIKDGANIRNGWLEITVAVPVKA